LKISKIFLYDEPAVPQIEINDLAKFLGREFQVDVEVRRSLFQHFETKDEVFEDLASCRIFNIRIPFEKHKPTREETGSEEQGQSGSIVLYDGFELQNIYRDLIPASEFSHNEFHLAFTTRLTCSYDSNDYRYHGRAVICSNPAIISTTGIIEAPAKPREYYLKIYEKIGQGLNLDRLKEEFRERFLDYNDLRLCKAARTYAMQAIFYHITGMPFCESKECMLYNAHWQEELIRMLEAGRLCSGHQAALDNYRKCSA